MTLLPDLRDLLGATAAEYDVPGAAVAVGVPGETVEAATGVLNLNTALDATPDSLFQIGSVTKVWTALLVLQLVDDGLVDLDKPVRGPLPEFAVVDEEATHTVTVRQLLSHTAGFVGDLFDDTGRGDDALDRYLTVLSASASQICPPGERFSYCNAGFSVLGALVARMRDSTWEAAVRDRIAGPLDLGNTAVFAEEAILRRASAGHIRRSGDDGYTMYHRWQLPRSIAPAGALSAAPRDLIGLGRVFAGTAGTAVVSPDTVRAMCTPQAEVPGADEHLGRNWGLGLALYDWHGTPVVGHNGRACGQVTAWRVIPDRDVVVAVCANGGRAGGFLNAVMRAVVGEVTGVAVPPMPAPPRTPAPMPAGVTRGSYTAPQLRCEVAPDATGIDLTVVPTEELAADIGMERTTYRYVPLAGDTFVAEEPEDGFHETLTLIDGGRYLYNSGRVLPRDA